MVVVVLVFDSVSGGDGSGLLDVGVGETIERVHFYSILVFKIQSPSKFICNGAIEMQILSQILAFCKFGRNYLTL